MPRANDAVEAMLVEYADLLSVLSSDPYKPRAYEKAARAVGGYPVDLAGKELADILQVPNVGKSIGEKVHEFLTTGTVADLDGLRAKIPAGVREVMAVPGVGPKKAMVLYQDLGVDSIDLLVEAIGEDKVAALPRFGAKTQENIAKGITQLRSAGDRVRIDLALDVAETFIDALRSLRRVQRITYAGSLRRMRETIGDVDLLVASGEAPPIMDAFVAHPSVARVLAHGDTKSSVITELGLQVDLRVVPPEAWGAALIYFTGSKAHNIRIREMAVRQGLKLSEYGLFVAEDGELLAAETEEQVYERLGMPYVEPTLREDRGEVEAALEGTLPTVITERQLKGDLHTHTNLTDGLASLEAMVERAAGLGYAYFAITDHAPNLYMQRMTDDKILAQRERVEKLRSSYPKMTLLHGTELNIDPDGNVDWDEDFLAGFDLTVASVHSHFNQSRDEMTKRVIRAIENPYVGVIGHLTTRQIGRRAPVDLDLEAIFEAAARTGTILEINSHPDRLDLRDDHVLWARRHGVRFAVNTDAHAVPHLEHRRFGIGVAQRGWLAKDDVVNAWPLAKLRRFLDRKRRGAPGSTTRS
jgi:DNA polymerase (family 10)